MQDSLVLVSHLLCPYVQRASIALHEKEIEHERIYVDLANKPDWFIDLSPLGKTPVLKVGEKAIFESAVILEFLEETQPRPLHPSDPLERAEHRSWIEFGSAILNEIAGMYNAKDKSAFEARVESLSAKFARLENRPIGSPWFDGEKFSLVDAVYAPAFRYFDTFDQIGDFGVLSNTPDLAKWRNALAARESVIKAVTPDYPELLKQFLRKRDSYISSLIS